MLHTGFGIGQLEHTRYPSINFVLSYDGPFFLSSVFKAISLDRSVFRDDYLDGESAQISALTS